MIPKPRFFSFPISWAWPGKNVLASIPTHDQTEMIHILYLNRRKLCERKHHKNGSSIEEIGVDSWQHAGGLEAEPLPHEEVLRKVYREREAADEAPPPHGRDGSSRRWWIRKKPADGWTARLHPVHHSSITSLLPPLISPFFFLFTRILIRLQEAAVVPPCVAFAIRPSPGFWEYVKVSANDLSVEGITPTDYLKYKEMTIDEAW